MISKTRVNFWIDAGMLSLVGLITLTGLGLWLLWPTGRGGADFFGLSLVYRGLRQVHQWAGLALLGVLVIHLSLHWHWLGCVIKRFRRKLAAQVCLNFGLDTLLLFVFGLVNLSGLALWLVFSGGYRGGRNPLYNAALWGLSRADWLDLHRWAGLAMVATVLIHLLLHWQWIVCAARNYTWLARCTAASKLSSTPP